LEEIDGQDIQEALQKCLWFLNNGEEPEKEKKQKKPLISWEQDFNYIVAPINRVRGEDVRAIPYDYKNNKGGFHWWSFLSAYMEIGGDCTFAQIVSIRQKLSSGKQLDKAEKQWYKEHRKMVDLQAQYTEADEDLIRQWV
jgi:hypothetical protein